MPKVTCRVHHILSLRGTLGKFRGNPAKIKKTEIRDEPSQTPQPTSLTNNKESKCLPEIRTTG